MSANEPSNTPSDSAVDVYAASAAMLCLVHCVAGTVALLMSLSLPFLENELFHKALVILTVPATIYVIYAEWRADNRGMSIIASLGILLLIAGAFFPPFESIETPVTIAGSVLVAAVHVRRLRFRRRLAI
ncbi:MAG: MerC domain-containing protein [Pseudomonadota bacterium]